jgi:hypothetical protein
MEVERPDVWATTEQREYDAEQRAMRVPSKANALQYLENVTKADAYREVAEDLRRPRRNRIYDEATEKYYTERRTQND